MQEFLEKHKFAILVVFGVLAAALLFSRNGNGPAPAPPPYSPALDLRSAFSTNDDRGQARKHAHSFGAICAALAEVLEYDGSLTSPRISSGVQVDDLRRWTRENHLQGRSFAAKYPGLKEAVEQHLTKSLGTSGKKLSAEQRARWVQAYRELAAAAEAAAR